MSRSGLPTTVVLCCGLPDGLAGGAVESCLSWGLRSGVPITWIASRERLRQVATAVTAADGAASVALDVPATVSRSRLRTTLMEAAAATPGIEAAAVQGGLTAELRRAFAEAGVRVVMRDRFDDTGPGPRRPAPRGWACRSVLWGLWEVTTSSATPPSALPRLLPWATRTALPQGGLAVPDLAQGKMLDASLLRSRVEQWQTWARRRPAGTVSFARLSDLPALAAGAGRMPDGGSVLKAA